MSELDRFLERYPDTAFFDVIYSDLCGITRGKRYPIEFAHKIMQDGLATPGSVFLLAVTGENMDADGFGFSDGDPDRVVRVLPGSLQTVPWARQPTAQAMLTFYNREGGPLYYEPRNVLRRVVDRFTALGLTPVVAFELEFYLVDAQRQSDGTPKPPDITGDGRPVSGTQVYGMNELDEMSELMADVSNACKTQGIPAQAMTSEYAPGQFEINLQHIDDALRAADDCVRFKRVVQGVARRHGLRATFMAKPYLGRAGSGMHLHVSLLDADGRNVFQGTGPDGSISEVMGHAIGGVLEGLPDSMAILAPNLNAYRRMAPNTYAPVSSSWGIENRSVALRVPAGAGADRRFEHRVAGADANPYLVLAAILAGVHRGITQVVSCPPPVEGNAGAVPDGDWPRRLRPALQRLRDSASMNDYLGEPYVRAYCDCKELEQDAFDRHMSKAEYDWYLLT